MHLKASGLNFSQALTTLKAGGIVSRAGWNGKGMFLILVPGTPDVKPYAGTPYSRVVQAEGTVTINAHIDMMTATGEMQPGWLANQTDLLAEDWTVLAYA